MIVLLVLFGALLFFRLLGVAGVDLFATWVASARAALAAMLAFTSLAPFGSMKKDRVAMVPPGLPRPDLLVGATGAAELLGAAGLLIPPARFWAASGLILLFISMLPANVSAVRRGVLLRGRRATPLWLRVPMQLLFIIWAFLVR
jgi:uncharacterized membrane protein